MHCEIKAFQSYRACGWWKNQCQCSNCSKGFPAVCGWPALSAANFRILRLLKKVLCTWSCKFYSSSLYVSSWIYSTLCCIWEVCNGCLVAEYGIISYWFNWACGKEYSINGSFCFTNWSSCFKTFISFSAFLTWRYSWMFSSSKVAWPTVRSKPPSIPVTIEVI